MFRSDFGLELSLLNAAPCVWGKFVPEFDHSKLKREFPDFSPRIPYSQAGWLTLAIFLGKGELAEVQCGSVGCIRT